MSKVLTVQVENLDEKGRGVAYYEGKPIFINYAVPGDEVEVEVIKVRRGKRIKEFIGRIRKIISYGSGRVTPKCKYFGECGGCRFQNWDYKYQLEYKKWLIENFMKKWGVKGQVDEVLPSPKIWYYRNRMDYAVSYDGKIGLKELGSWRNILDIDECFLLSPHSNEILSLIREFMRLHNIKGWDLIKHTGMIRYVVIREGKFTNERLVNIITYQRTFKHLEKLRDDIVKKGLITSLVWGINPEITDISIAKELRFIWGKDHLTEKINNYTFHIHPNAFFQTNSYQTINLVKEVVENCIQGNKALDLYSGVGLFSLFISEYFNEVIGIEVEETSVMSAEINLKWNNINNVRFLVGRAEDLINIIHDIDMVVIDPPRPGMSYKVIRGLKRLSPKRIIYVSCNPDSMMRDISLLSEYKLAYPVKPIDLFPQTPHIEAVAILDKV